MRYLLGKALKRFGAGPRGYLLFILQIAIGVCLVALALNIRFTFEQAFSAFLERADHPYISIYGGEGLGSSARAIPLEDYRSIREEIGPAGEAVAYYKITGLSDADFTHYLPVLFVDENFYSLLMRVENPPGLDSVFIGSRARGVAEGLTRAQGGRGSPYVDGQTVLGVPLSAMRPMESLGYGTLALLEDGYLPGMGENLDFEDYIIFPVSMYESLPEQPQTIDNLAVMTGGNDDAIGLTRQILAGLRERHEGDDYLIVNHYAMAEETLNKNVHVAELLNFLAAFILVIVVLGFTGLLLILVHRRSREFAIAIMSGAAPGQVTLELCIEIFLVVLTGVCAGNLVSIPVLSLMENETYHAQTFLLTLLGGVVVSVLVCLIPFYKMRRIAPVSILKNE